MSRRRVNSFDPTSKKYLRLQRRMDINSLNWAIRVLKRFGSHDNLVAATAAISSISSPAREKAREVGE